MSSFLERLNANLEKALAKKKKKKKDESLPENCSEIDAKVSFVKDGSLVTPDLAGNVKDFLFQVPFIFMILFTNVVGIQIWD